MAFAEKMNTSWGAYLVRGGNEMIGPVLASLRHVGLDTQGNPDLHIREYLQFGIEEARELRLRAGSRAIKETHRTFIIVSSSMTAEAQNALLKTLEEPRADAAFYFIVSSPETLLPTLLSRVHIMPFSAEHSESESVNAGEFLRAAKAERLEMLKKLLPKEGETRNTGAIIAFLASVEKMLGELGGRKSKEGLEAVYLARKYTADKGSLLKPLLEQVALLVPEA